MLSQLVAAEAEGDKLTMDELLSTTVTFLVAGHETTTSLLGNGVLTLMQHRDQWDAMTADPALVPRAVEEILRFESPVSRQPRLLRRDAELGGRRLKEGDVAFQMLGGANRDPAVFDRPDEFDIRRDPNRHIAFGLGPHFCIGAPLSRAEGPDRAHHADEADAEPRARRHAAVGPRQAQFARAAGTAGPLVRAAAAARSAVAAPTRPRSCTTERQSSSRSSSVAAAVLRPTT